MEQRLLAEFSDQKPPNPSPFALQLPLLSLITNPSTSLFTLSSLLKTLTLRLQCPTTHHHHHRILLSLLSALSDHHPNLRREIFLAVRAFALLPSTTTSSLAHSLSVLFKDDADVTNDVANESMFLSICFHQGKSASLRRWVLQNVDKFSVRPSVLITVLLGLTKDPYPLTRGTALDGLAWLPKFVAVEDQSLVQCCYFRATELLFDAEDSVRCSAIRAVSEWGQLIVESNQDKCKIDWSDALFVQLCSMVRDMSVKVRIEAFDALAKVRMVSQEVLLQTLTKKATSATKEKTCPGQYTPKMNKLPASTAAFAFIHGLEDEFFEVRRSACRALRTFTILDGDFACEAVNLLMDMLNDDSVIVRLQALETMRHMAMFDCLKLQEEHLHMLLGALVEDSALIRSAARRILRLTKLHKLSIFKLCFEGLMRNLELYPQDEADLLSVLLNIGQNHGRFIVQLIEENLEKIECSFGGSSGFESARTNAFLVLVISAPVSIEKSICSIPPRMYSYAVTLLGRISNGLAGSLNQNDLLSHLSHCSRFSYASSSEFFKGEESAAALVNDDLFFWPKSDGNYGSYSQTLFELEKVYPIADHPLKMHDEIKSCISNVLQQIHNVWPLVRCGFSDEATRTLRSWKKELKTFTCDSSELKAELVFVLQYLHAIKLLGRVWIHFMFPLKPCSLGAGELAVLLGKLEKSLKEIKYRFIGFSSKQELHILELLLMTHILKISNLKACCPSSTLKKISSAVAHVEHLVGGRLDELSSFVIELQKILSEIGSSTDILGNAFLLHKVLQTSLEYYSLRQFMFSGILLHMEAQLDVCNNYENPLHYVLGLPVGIPLEITLRNISKETRIWLKMTFEEKLAQFVYLDLHGLSGSDEIRKFTHVAPFYGTPKASCFTLKVSIALECLSEPACQSNVSGGPKHELINISGEKEVFLSAVVK